MTALSRLLHRITGPSEKRQIEAGGGGRRWQGSPMLTAPQQSILAARGLASQRAAALTMNNPTAARIVEAWVTPPVAPMWCLSAAACSS